jgi:ribokinase
LALSRQAAFFEIGTTMNNSKLILVVGSINTDLVVSSSRLPLAGETITGNSFSTFQGGKGANQAVAAARLGSEVMMVGKVGSDSFGLESIRQMKSQGVDCEHVELETGDSGVAVINVAHGGQNTIIVVPGANAHVTPAFVDSKRSQIKIAAIVLAQLEIPTESVVRLAAICREEQVPFMLDPAPARTLPSVLLSNCTWFTPNETEAAFFAPEASRLESVNGIAKALLGQGPQNILLKMGERGAYISQPGLEGITVAAKRVIAVDATAAGDTYNGAFATALVSGYDIGYCARFAATAAAISVTRQGAQASMPTLDEVENSLSNEAV